MSTIIGLTPMRSTGTPSTPSTATPNSSSAITNAIAGGAMGKDQFVKLLVAEMQNQDPTSPMDGKQLAAQLAQFSSVEQLMNINTKLDTLTQVLTPATTSKPAGTAPSTAAAPTATAPTG